MGTPRATYRHVKFPKRWQRAVTVLVGGLLIAPAVFKLGLLSWAGAGLTLVGLIVVVVGAFGVYERTTITEEYDGLPEDQPRH